MLLVMTLAGLSQISGALAAPLTQGQELAIILDPAPGSTVQGTVQINGSADHPQFQFYVIEVSPEPGEQWQFVGDSSTAVVNGPLATWDTNTLPDGVYVLRLRVVRVDGNYSEVFTQQVSISNSQPLPTVTPAGTATPAAPAAPLTPTITPTPLPPTPTILIDQPIVDTPTPRPVEPTVVLEDPDEATSLIPEVSGFSLTPLRDACIYGGAVMLGIFLLFGFFSALRVFVQGFIDAIKRRREKRNQKRQ